MFDAKFGHPRGTAGRIGGAIMVLANAELGGAAAARELSMPCSR
ncbi:MAG TPA: hypothetical protein VEF72_13915 [Mycobacterium sp.]|nr:hypothetical protein [Mycobacterium sp.]